MPDVQLFATCIVNHIYPDVAWSVAEVLQRHAVTVHVPAGQTCCGQPAFNAGYTHEARAMARHTLDVLSVTEGAVIVPSGSCADMLVHHYPALLADDPTYSPQAKALATRVYEFGQYLVDVLGLDDVAAHYDGTLTYHPTCHLLRGLQVDGQTRRLLANVNGSKLVELPDAETCCGFGGMFAVKMSEISGAMLQRKLDNVAKTGADALVGCDMSCMMHIAGGMQRQGDGPRVLHLAQLLRGAKQ